MHSKIDPTPLPPEWAQQLRARQGVEAIAASTTRSLLLPSSLIALLTVACSPVVGGSAGRAWRAWRQDASVIGGRSGPVEATFAGALGVRLGGGRPAASQVASGVNGKPPKPVVGGGRVPDAGDVTRAAELSRLVSAAGTAITLAAGLIGWRQLHKFVTRKAAQRATSRVRC